MAARARQTRQGDARSSQEKKPAAATKGEKEDKEEYEPVTEDMDKVLNEHARHYVELDEFKKDWLANHPYTSED